MVPVVGGFPDSPDFEVGVPGAAPAELNIGGGIFGLNITGGIPGGGPLRNGANPLAGGGILKMAGGIIVAILRRYGRKVEASS